MSLSSRHRGRPRDRPDDGHPDLQERDVLREEKDEDAPPPPLVSTKETKINLQQQLSLNLEPRGGDQTALSGIDVINAAVLKTFPVSSSGRCLFKEAHEAPASITSVSQIQQQKPNSRLDSEDVMEPLTASLSQV